MEARRASFHSIMVSFGLLCVANPVAAGSSNCAGDTNGDSQVDVTDLVNVILDFGSDGTAHGGDVGCDGVVDVNDLVTVVVNWNACNPFLQLVWPMPGVDTHDWVINNYIDLDPGPALLDYMGGTKTYNGHNGVDIDVPNFRWMDGNFPILAAAAGMVVALDDAHYDRYTFCGPTPWNFVTVEHCNGWRTIYGHLKQNSVVVSLGQPVTAGQILGVVGSSGCSTAPHLHLEVRDASNAVVDPFLEGMWLDPPVYDTPLGFMDAVIDDDAINNVNVIKDPPPNITEIQPGKVVGVGLSMAGGEAGDQTQIRLHRPNGTLFDQCTITFNQVHRHSYWYCNLAIGQEEGDWSVEIRLNGVAVASYDLAVAPGGDPDPQQVRFAVPLASYQTVFDDLVGEGYRPIWVDGYDLNGSAHFNAVFDLSSPGAWQAAHQLSGAQYQALFDALVSQGYRLVHVDSYLSAGAIRYAALFVQQGGSAWVTYHGATNAQHQSSFDSLVAQGYRPVVISPVELGGTTYVTALYDQDDVGSLWAQHGLTESQYQTVFDQQTAAGRTLAYLNGYVGAGSARLSAIWNSMNPSAWVARHGLSEGQLQSELDMWTGQGLLTRFITGYQDGPVANFGAFWSD